MQTRESIEELKRGGVYTIINRINGKRYVGQSSNMYQRKGDHSSRAHQERKPSEHKNMYADILKHGTDNFSFEVLLYSESKSEREQVEEKYIVKLQTVSNGYNSAVNHVEISERAYAKIRKPVEYFSLEGESLGTFNSVREASSALSLDGSGISKCCLGKTRHCGGFIWRHTS